MLKCTCTIVESAGVNSLISRYTWTLFGIPLLVYDRLERA